MVKKASLLMVALLSISMVILVFNVRPAEAVAQTIYINADGSITPVGAPIETSDNMTYSLTGDITYLTYARIAAQRSNVIIDGKGYTVQGNQSEIGLYLSNVNNVTVKNTNVKNFSIGIFLSNSNYSIVAENNIIGCDQAISLYQSSNASIDGNSVTNNQYGISVGFSSNYNSISGNKIGNNGYGIGLAYSNENSVSGNNITANVFYGIELFYSSNDSLSGNVFTYDGLFVRDSYQNSVENNNVNDKPLVYLEGAVNQTVSDAGQVILVRCESIRVENLNLSRANIGLELWETNNSIISGNNIANNTNDIELWNSSNNSLSGNNITNSGYGIEHQADVGIDLYYSSNNSISENNLENNPTGLFLYSSGNNSVSGNNIATSIANNYYVGLWLRQSSGCKIYHNNFINIRTLAATDGQSISTWDDSYPSGGNYWSAYHSVDLKSGPHQNETGSDGIGDVEYVIDANNTDHYPLMGPFDTFDAGTWNGVTYNVDVVSNSTVSNFSFNSAQKAITFNVTGSSGTSGFCRVTIQGTLLAGPYTVLVNSALPLSQNEVSNGTHTFLYFTYDHSTQQVNIIGATAVPEFPSTTVLLLLMLLSILAVIGLHVREKTWE